MGGRPGCIPCLTVFRRQKTLWCVCPGLRVRGQTQRHGQRKGELLGLVRAKKYGQGFNQVCRDGQSSVEVAIRATALRPPRENRIM